MTELKKARILTLVIALAGVTIALLWRLVPPPAGAEGTEFYSPIGTPTTLLDLTLATGSGLLFWRAVRNFKKELKPAYLFIAGAQLAVGILTLFFPYVEYYGLWSNVWLNMATYLAYFVGSIFMYFGARQFLKRLGLRSRISAPAVVIGATLLVWVIHGIAPHNVTWDQFNEHQYDLFELVVIIPVLWYAAAAYIVFKIRRVVGSTYQKSFTWLCVGLTLQMASSVTVLVLDTTGYENWYFASRAYELPTLIADMAILFAAYSFNTVGLLAVRPRAAASSLDIVLYAATMVSNPEPIDPALDEVRLITSRAASDTAVRLSAEDQKKL
jgi:hypothetical protein